MGLYIVSVLILFLLWRCIVVLRKDGIRKASMTLIAMIIVIAMVIPYFLQYI